MRVVFSSIFYPVFMGGYILAALKRRKDVELFTTGPFTGDWIPWNGGMTVKAKFKPDLPMPSQWIGMRPPIAYVESKLPWKADVWIQVDAGFYLEGYPLYGVNCFVATDPHVLSYDRQRLLADKFFCMQQVYAKPGDLYLPYAYDPEWHRPEKQPKEFDACLIGLHYQQRDALVNALKAKGRSVYYNIGPAYEQARAFYNQSKIGLNWSSLQDLNARAFELLAFGLPAVMNRVPDMTGFFRDGVDYMGFDSLEEAVQAAEYLLDNPKLADQIAKSGRKAVAPHTWDARVEEILSKCQ